MTDPLKDKFNNANEGKGPFVEGMDYKPRELTRTVPHDMTSPAPAGAGHRPTKAELWDQNKVLAESLQNDIKNVKSGKELDNSMSNKGELKKEFNERSV